MPIAVIVDAVRTPGGKRNGKLRNWHPVDLASEALRAIASRNNLDPALVDDVIMGCVSQVGEQAFNVGRNAVLAAGWPESVPATTIDRQCGSSQQALHFAAQGVMSGAYDIVVAAGVEVMSRVAMGSSIGKDSGLPMGPRVHARYEPVGGLKTLTPSRPRATVARPKPPPKAASSGRSSRSTYATRTVNPPASS
jgi:acetyl-CoA acetyltransferase